jgi:hypothetical protein
MINQSKFVRELRIPDQKLMDEILHIIEPRVGIKYSISRRSLNYRLRDLGFGKKASYKTFDRRIRTSIKNLRRQDHLICSSSNESGYFMAKNREEFDYFMSHEMRSKIADMATTINAMERSADKKFGPREIPDQPSLLPLDQLCN